MLLLITAHHTHTHTLSESAFFRHLGRICTDYVVPDIHLLDVQRLLGRKLMHSLYYILWCCSVNGSLTVNAWFNVFNYGRLSNMIWQLNTCEHCRPFICSEVIFFREILFNFIKMLKWSGHILTIHSLWGKMASSGAQAIWEICLRIKTNIFD